MQEFHGLSCETGSPCYILRTNNTKPYTIPPTATKLAMSPKLPIKMSPTILNKLTTFHRRRVCCRYSDDRM